MVRKRPESSKYQKKKQINFNNNFTASACYKTKICDNGQNLVALLINKDANVNEVVRKGISILALGE